MNKAKIWHRIKNEDKSRLEARATRPGHDGHIRLALEWSERGDSLSLFIDGCAAGFKVKTSDVTKDALELEAKENIERRYALVPWTPRTYNIGVDITAAEGWQSYNIVAASEEEAISMFNSGDPSVVFDSDPYIEKSEEREEGLEGSECARLKTAMEIITVLKNLLDDRDRELSELKAAQSSDPIAPVFTCKTSNDAPPKFFVNTDGIRNLLLDAKKGAGLIVHQNKKASDVDLARLVGVSKSTLTAWRNGKSVNIDYAARALVALRELHNQTLSLIKRCAQEMPQFQ